MRNDRSHIWYSSHPEPNSIGSEIVAATLNWGSLHREGSNIESREMIVETVDSHILLSPVQVLNQTCFGGERGRGSREQQPGGGSSGRGHQTGVL